MSEFGEPWGCSDRDMRNVAHRHNWYLTSDHTEDDDGAYCTSVGVVLGNLTSGSIAEQKARRIVACVNACAGIPSAALTSDTVRELVAAARAVLAANNGPEWPGSAVAYDDACERIVAALAPFAALESKK